MQCGRGAHHPGRAVAAAEVAQRRHAPPHVGDVHVAAGTEESLGAEAGRAGIV